MDASSIWKPSRKKRALNNTLFPLLYTLLTAGVWLVALPLLFLYSFKKKYRHAIPARFFLWRNPPLPKERVWFHACSFGETRALKPLIQELPKHETAMTVTTQTGYEEARTVVDTVRYLPFEPLLWIWIRPQKALIVMEAELWYLLFYLAKRRGAVTMLVNARISDRSWPRYRRFAWFYRHLFAQVDDVYAQSELDAERLRVLGAKKVTVTGNIKLAHLPSPSLSIPRPEGIVVTAASTHEGEEEGIVSAFLTFKKRHPDAKLIVVPRHPERFERVFRMLRSVATREGLELSRWSLASSLQGDIVLVDRMGMLVEIYAVTDIVVLGGAFVPIGGHNPAEVLPFGCRLVSGNHIFNQRAMFDAVEGAIFCELEDLAQALERALEAPPLTMKTKVSLEPLKEALRHVV